MWKYRIKTTLWWGWPYVFIAAMGVSFDFEPSIMRVWWLVAVAFVMLTLAFILLVPQPKPPKGKWWIQSHSIYRTYLPGMCVWHDEAWCEDKEGAVKYLKISRKQSWGGDWGIIYRIRFEEDNK